MSETKPGTSPTIAGSVAQKMAVHIAGGRARGERARMLALGWRGDVFEHTEVDEGLSVPFGKERNACRGTVDLVAAGWRFLPAPRFINRSGMGASRSLAPALEWQAPRWAVIPPEGLGAVARTFPRKGEAIAWARSAMEGADPTTR